MQQNHIVKENKLVKKSPPGSQALVDEPVDQTEPEMVGCWTC